MQIRKSNAEDKDTLLSALQSNNSQIRSSAVEKLGSIRDEKAVDALMDFIALKEEDWRIKTRAIRLLGDIGNPRSADLLMKIFSDPFLNNECPAIKWNIAIALGNFKNDSRVVHTLISALNYDNLIVREAVIQSLGNIGDSKAVPFLIPALSDKSFAIKLSAVRALGKIGDSGAIPFLKRVADNENDPYIKDEALSALTVLQ